MNASAEVAGAVAQEVAEVARIVAAAGLVEAFGHVSARLGRTFVITSIAPLGAMRADDVSGPGTPGRPLETAAHAAIYQSRNDVSAICRTHSPAAVSWGARATVPPVVHGLGGLSGSIATLSETELLDDPSRANVAVRALGRADVLLVRGNGAFCTGPDLPTACVRAWFLEERTRLARDAWPGAPVIEDDELDARARHYPTESARAWRWLRWRFLDDTHPIPSEER